MSEVIGSRLVLVNGFTKWAIYDFDKKKIFRFSPLLGKFLVSLHKKDIDRLTKINFIKTNYPELDQLLCESDLTDRLFQTWTTNLKIENYDRKKIWIELTNRCNFKCLHCYNSAAPINTSYLKTNKVLEIIHQAASLNLNSIQFTGGEPLLHPDVNRILTEARESFHDYIELYSNLSLLSDNHLRTLKECNIAVATTMLGSRPEVFDKCTNHDGAFNKWLRSVLKVQDSGLQLRVSLVRMRHNQDDIENMKIFLKERLLIKNESDFFPDDVRPIGRAKENILPTIPYTDSKRDKLFVEVSEKKWFFSNVYNSCWGGSLAISAVGDVFPCIFARTEKTGNVYQHSLDQIVQKKAIDYWTITLDKVEQCKDCEFRYACYDCRAISLNYGLGLYGKPVRCNYDPYVGEVIGSQDNVIMN